MPTGTTKQNTFKDCLNNKNLPGIGAATASDFHRQGHTALNGTNSTQRNAALICANSDSSSPIVGAAKASDYIRPGNNALLGQVSRVSNSSSDLYHPTSLVWTIDNIKEFVSIDSLMIICVQQQKGKSTSPVCDEDSAVVHVTTH